MHPQSSGRSSCSRTAAVAITISLPVHPDHQDTHTTQCTTERSPSRMMQELCEIPVDQNFLITCCDSHAWPTSESPTPQRSTMRALPKQPCGPPSPLYRTSPVLLLLQLQERRRIDKAAHQTSYHQSGIPLTIAIEHTRLLSQAPLPPSYRGHTKPHAKNPSITSLFKLT
jgi:hypothetical protein